MVVIFNGRYATFVPTGSVLSDGLGLFFSPCPQTHVASSSCRVAFWEDLVSLLWLSRGASLDVPS